MGRWSQHLPWDAHVVQTWPSMLALWRLGAQAKQPGLKQKVLGTPDDAGTSLRARDSFLPCTSCPAAAEEGDQRPVLNPTIWQRRRSTCHDALPWAAKFFEQNQDTSMAPHEGIVNVRVSFSNLAWSSVWFCCMGNADPPTR